MQATRSPERRLTSTRLCGVRTQKLALFQLKCIIIIIIIVVVDVVGSGGMVEANHGNFC
jgi:t-SNARE complex subunit (syntaxin)